MKIELPPITDEEKTPLVLKLLEIIHLLFQFVAQLQEKFQQVLDENAILKRQKPKPKISPSRLESTSRPSPPFPEKRPGSQKRAKNSLLVIHEEVPLTIPPEKLPSGAVLIGFEPYVVQDLLIQPKNTRYQRGRYSLPDGTTILAPLPNDVPDGSHFGTGLMAFILHQYHHNHVTQPLLQEQLEDFGIDISSGQLSNILTEDKEAFHQEKQEILTAGILVSGYIGVDDTGARHQGQNGFCTVISSDFFSYFESTDSKSRLNFLRILRGTHTDYVINDVSQAYWEKQKLAQAVIQTLDQDPLRFFATEEAWQEHLKKLEIKDERHIRIATEGALLGSLIHHGVSPSLVVLSDGARQFDILVHAACWVHAERPLARMIAIGDAHREAIEKARQGIWDFYQKLKSYRDHPDPDQCSVLEAEFDNLVGQKTGFDSIDTVFEAMKASKADLLCVLAHPQVPLHNNDSESAIRDYVKKRKISGSTRSQAGRKARDTFASLKKTCKKLGIRFWDYLQDRLRGLNAIPRLGELIRQKAAEKQAMKVEAVPG